MLCKKDLRQILKKLKANNSNLTKISFRLLDLNFAQNEFLSCHFDGIFQHLMNNDFAMIIQMDTAGNMNYIYLTKNVQAFIMFNTFYKAYFPYA